MLRQKHFSIPALTLITAFSLLLVGCGSTDSDTEDGSGSNPSVDFNSGNIPPGGSFSYSFTEEGEVEYYCNIHAPDMQGKVTVTGGVDALERDTVVMQNEQFNPSQLSVAPNTEVVWINQANVDHTVISGNPGSSNDGDLY